VADAVASLRSLDFRKELIVRFQDISPYVAGAGIMGLRDILDKGGQLPPTRDGNIWHPFFRVLPLPEMLTLSGLLCRTLSRRCGL
jgi:hypothetical protein